MLLQFVVENFLSFRDKAVLSMVAADGVDHHEEHVLRVRGLPPVLKCAAIYGANASGKSNLVKALQFAVELICNGRASGEPIGVRPFKLDDDSATKPSRFEVDFYAGGKHYSYGFLASAQRIDAEWLVLVDGNEEDELFDRTVAASQPDKPLIHIHDAMSGDPERRQFLRFIAEGTRPNQLFLKELTERNFGELGPVFTWFAHFLRIPPEGNYYSSHYIEQEDVRELIADFLRNVDTGISDVRTFRAPTKASDLPDYAIASLKKSSIGFARSGEAVVANESSGDPEIVKIRLQHQGKDGHMSFDLDEESDGTRRLLALVPLLYGVKEGNGRIAIDELERSLHPLLTSAFVHAFLENTPAESTGQLLFTTHDTNLLDPALLPPDSTWFVEKDPHGASTLHSLAEYKGEHLEHIKSLERGYLQGRFGGIPLIRTRTKLGTRRAP